MNNLRNEIFLKNFGINLKKNRISEGFTQEELSYSSDVSLAQITRLERGIVNPTICTLKCLAKAWGIEIKQLFDFPHWNYCNWYAPKSGFVGLSKFKISFGAYG